MTFVTKITCLIMLLYATSTLAIPVWAKRSQFREGNQFTVVCTASGMSLEVARRNALDSCDSLAARQLTTEIKVKNLSVETDLDIAYHSEIGHEVVITNLKCVPVNETFEIKDELTEVIIQCRYDLNLAKVEPLNSGNEKFQSTELATSESIGERQIISVATTPPCESILVRGNAPRVVRCLGKNPVTIPVTSSDSAMIIRAVGFKPYTVAPPFKDKVYVQLQK